MSTCINQFRFFCSDNWLLSNNLMINSFSVKRNIQRSTLAAHLVTAVISHEIAGVMFKSFHCQMYLDNSVLFLYLRIKLFFVISETLLERCFRNPKIKFIFIIYVVFNVSTVDNLGSQTLILQWTFIP